MRQFAYISLQDSSSHFSFECKAAARTPEFAGPISGAVPSFCAEFGEVMQIHKWLRVGWVDESMMSIEQTASS